MADLGMLPDVGLRLLGPLNELLEGLVPGWLPILLNLGRDSLSKLNDLPELDRYGLIR